MSSQSPSPSTEAMREHFVKRLIPHVSIQGNTSGSQGLTMLLGCMLSQYFLLTGERGLACGFAVAASQARISATHRGIGDSYTTRWYK